MTKEFSSIVELKSIREQKSRLSDAYSGGYPFSISGDIRSVPS